MTAWNPWPPQPPPKPKANVGLIVAAIFAGSAVLGLIAALVVAFGSDDTTSVESKPEPSAQATPTGVLSGDSSEWFDAVCQPGSYVENVGVQSATASASCAGPKGQTIFIARFADRFTMKNGLTVLGAQHYAAGSLPNGSIMTIVDLYDGSALGALSQFGFVIQ